MNAMKNKIKSQRGASITFALLLFLVCAVISGVVIVAATTAAGRMSTQGEMDERYYAVTAAAKQLNEIYDGKEVVMKYDLKDDGKPNIDSVVASYSDDSPVPNPGILYRASKDVLQGVLYKEIDSILEPTTITMTDADSKVSCTVDRKMHTDGRMEYTISAKKTENASNSGQYTVVMTFSPNVSSSMTNASTHKGQATIMWKLLGAKKNRATVL